MLRIYQATSAGAAKQYYTDALARQDYYVDGQELPGMWGGRAATYLGLEGPVTQKAFAHLCDNLHPQSGERLTPRTRDDRTVGYDINFHTPKGVSILHALTGDQRVVEAVHRAVAATMAEMETSVHTRVRLGGRSEDRHTGNLIWGGFTHFTTRPVDGVPDPHLHVHCFVFNSTFDPVEQRFKAGQFRQLVQRHPYYQAAYHARLARELSEIGYPIERHPDGWDLRGIDRSLVETYSRRTAEIEAECKRLGITDPAEKDQVGARTRATKDQQLGLGELRRVWQGRLSSEHAEWLHRVVQEPERRREGTDAGTPQIGDRPLKTVDEALEHAIRHVYERLAVESDYRLAAEALKHTLADVTPEQVWAAIDRHPDLLTRTEQGTRLVTTRSVLAEEQAVLRFAVDGRGTKVPLGHGHGGRPGTRYDIGATARQSGIELNAPQLAAVEHLVSSRDRVMLLRGGAGTGKTTLLQEARAAIEHGGHRVFACAVTSDASRGVLREAGFRDACPVQKLLTDRSLHEQMAGQVIWVDEAGMMGTPTAKKLFDLAGKIDARVVLSGDLKQHAPVERGDAMGLLERRAGIRAAEVNEILRQKGLYKDAVDAVQKGRLADSVRMLDELGAISEFRGIRDHEQPERRHKALAEKYVDAIERRRTALVVSPTHAEGRQVTEQIRDRLKDKGVIDAATERSFTRLQDLQWTDAQKADPHNYTPGMVVQYTQHCPGSTRLGIKPAAGNTKATILAVDPDKRLITTEDAAGNRRPLPLDLAGRFQVFEQQDITLAVGDRVRITRNAHTMTRDGQGRPATQRRVHNGTTYGIKGFTKDGHIKLDNKSGWVLHRDIGHLAHGYCSTPQAAQGKSVDVTLAAVSGSSLSASTLEQVYVMLSRGKKSCELITDSRRSLIDAMARLDQPRSATELVEDGGAAQAEKRRAHAREVQRMRQLEATRSRLRHDRQQQHQPDRQRGTPERERSAQQQPPRQRPGKEQPGRERER